MHFGACQRWGARSQGEHWKTGDFVDDNSCFSFTPFAGSQENRPRLHFSLKGITWLQAELAPDWARKDDLAFR